MQGAPADEYFHVNTELTLRLARQAKSQDIQHFIFLSTAHVFGDSGSLEDHQKLWNAEQKCHPQDPYGLSKLKAEQQLLQLADANFQVSILRPPMVYGAGAKGNILSLIKLIKLFPVLPLGYRLNRRSLIYVGNLCHFMHVLLGHPKTGVFLPQDEHPVSIAELTSTLCQALQKKRWIFPLSSWTVKTLRKIFPCQVDRLFGSLALEKDSYLFQFPPPFTTYEGFKEMLQKDATHGT